MEGIYNIILTAYVVILTSVTVLAVIITAVIAIKELSARKENYDNTGDKKDT